MVAFGAILMIAGVLGVILGFAMDVSIGSRVATDRFVNLQLLLTQQDIVIISGFAFVSGTVLVTGGVMRDALRATSVHGSSLNLPDQGKSPSHSPIEPQQSRTPTIDETPEGNFRVENREFKTREDAEAYVDLAQRQRR